MTKAICLLALLLPTTGCSITSLAWDDAIDKRVTTLETRMSAMETQIAQQKSVAQARVR